MSYSRLGGYDGATRRVPAAPNPCGPPAQAAPKQVLGSNLENQIIGNGLLTCAVPRVDQKPLWPQIPAAPKTCGPKFCGPKFPWTQIVGSKREPCRKIFWSTDLGPHLGPREFGSTIWVPRQQNLGPRIAPRDLGTKIWVPRQHL